MPGGGTLCIVANCKSNSKRAKQGDQLIRFFSFPSKPSLEQEWVKACQQKKDFDPKVKKVCSLHFKKGDFEDELKAQIMNYSPKKLKKGAIPSLNLPSGEEPEPASTASSVQPKRGRTKRNLPKKRNLFEECLKQYSEIQVKNTTNKGKEKVSYLNTREILPRLILKKKKKSPAKLKRQSTVEEQPKEITSDVHSGVEDQEKAQPGKAKKRKGTPIKLKKQLVQDSSDDESSSDCKASKIIEFTPPDKMANYSEELRKRIEKEVVSYFGKGQVISSEGSVCTNKNCQRQLKALDEEIDSLKKVIISHLQIKADLENKLSALQKKFDSKLDSSFEDKAKELFKDFLSSNQIHVALKKKTKPWWTKEDMSKAFSILYFSKRCYQHLRNTLNYPLPGLSTLRKWTSGMNKAYPLESNPLDPSANFEGNYSDEDEQGQNVGLAHSNSSGHPINSENLPSDGSSPEKVQQLQNASFKPCGVNDIANSEILPAGGSNSTSGGDMHINNSHITQYVKIAPKDTLHQEGISDENLNLVGEQVQSETTETISNNSKNLPSKGKISKNGKFKRRRPLIASKKFEFQSYLKNYLNKKNLVTAPSSSAKEKPFTCSICRLGFDKNIALQRHYKIHASEDPWKCDVCEDVFISKYYLEKHILTHKDDNNKYVCDICNRSFIQKNSFKDHYLLHRNLQPLEPCKESPNKGEQNALAQPDPNTLGSEKPSSDSSLVPTQHASPKDKPYSCHVCNESFENKNALKSHLPVHGQKVKKMFRKRYNCTKCSKEFKFSLSYQKHIQICGVDLSTLKGPLPVHKRVKKVFNKIYTCPTCNKIFKFHHSFEKHLQTCEEKKVYMCEVCDKTFSHPWSARRHMLLHDQETWFYCEICNKGFKQKYYLKQHMIVHSGEKPFVCEWCDKRFAQNSTLKKHIEAHKNGNYSKSTTQSKKSKVETPPATSYPNTNYPLNPNTIRNPMEMPSCASFPNTNYPIDPNLKRNPMEMPSSSYYYLTQL